MNFNPEMMENMKKFMTPDNMKFASDYIKNMNDDQLRQFGQMSGQNLSPEMMKMAASQMQFDTLNRQNSQPSTNNLNNKPSQPTQKKIESKKNEKSNIDNNDFAFKKEMTPIERIENIKKAGNEYFNKKKA